MKNIPEDDIPVLAKLNYKGLVKYDVLIFKNNMWRYQFDLSYLTNNESVLDWVYCENVEFNPIDIESITLTRSDYWTEVWATINKEKILLIKEIFDNNFHHCITKTGIKSLLGLKNE